MGVAALADGARREPDLSRGFLISLAALLVVVLTVALLVLIVPVAIALAWLGISRQRRVRKKHAALRAAR